MLASRLDLPGGIEKIVVNTANLFARNGHQVTIIILDETDKTFYPVSSSVKIIQENLSFGITRQGNTISRKIKLLADILKLKKTLKQLKPDTVIASENIFAAATIISGSKKNTRIVSWEHHHYYELEKNRFWNSVFTHTYPRLDAVVCLNIDEKNMFTAINANPVVIPNYIEKHFKSGLKNKLLLTVGRLTKVKGTDLLLQTAKLILQLHPEWQWKLIGDGDMKDIVLKFIEKENLQNRLLIQPPLYYDIIEEYQNASLYVMTSRNECLPMTLLEAQSVGLPCIAFNCETGPRHIIINNETGLLVEKENPIALAEAITSLINDEERRLLISKKAFENMHRFADEEVYKQWQEKIFTL